jgi:hypothetical protein
VFRNYTGMPLVGAAQSKARRPYAALSEIKTEAGKTIIRHA